MKLTNLKTDYLGRNYVFFNKIDSTQSEIWRMIENGTITNGTLVMADIQTNGKGTHGRVWYTDESNNIAFSFYVKTNCSISKLNGLTIEIAQILVDVLKKEYNINIDIKKPNDLVINNKKIGGILTEGKVSKEIVKYLVIGIGINVLKTSFSEDIVNSATSIKREFEADVDIMKIISIFCNRFEECIKRRINL